MIGQQCTQPERDSMSTPEHDVASTEVATREAHAVVPAEFE